jgi:transcriptional regulator with XRE-family HTH domain
VGRILAGVQLRRLREAAGISLARAGDALRASQASINRLEVGRARIERRELENLLTIYGVTDSRERIALIRLAVPNDPATGLINDEGWLWQRDDNQLPHWFEMYVQLERQACHVRAFQLQHVPDLLQCEDYARRLIASIHVGEPGVEIDRRVQARINRQRMLLEPGAPRFWAVVDQGALQCTMGSPSLLRSQLCHLLEMTTLDNVTIQMLPFSAQYAAAGASFTLLRFFEPDISDVVYLEQPDSAIYLDRSSDVDVYRQVINHASMQALTPLETRAEIMKMVESLSE